MRTLTAILAVAATFAAAGDDLYRQRPGGAEAYYVSVSTPVDVGGVEHDLDSGRLVFDYAEAANDWLYLGFSVGLSFDNMQSEPLIADTDPTGYTFGVFAGARFLELGPFALNLEGRHQRVADSGTGSVQESEMQYTETSFRLGALYRWEKVELGAGGYTLAVDGDLESTGTVIGTATFAEVETSGAYALVRLAIDGGFALGLRAESGARESLAFTFSTRF